MFGCGQDELNYLNYAKIKLNKKDVSIIDAGSNDGSFTELFLSVFPEGNSYCFEPIPEIYNKLCDKFKDNEKVHTYNVGLSDEFNECAKFYYLQNGFSGMSSLWYREKYFPNYIVKEIEVPLITLDSLMDRLPHIEYIHYDMEGGELFALQGAENFITRGKPEFIQVEVGEGYNDSGTTFAEVLDFLNSLGYRVINQNGRIMLPQDVVEGTPLLYDCQNYLAELII